MKREFTKLMAALALLLFIAPLGMWGQTTVASFSRSGTSNSTTGGTFSATFSGKTGYYQDNTGDCYMQILNSSGYWTTTPTSISFAAKIGGGSGNTDLTDPVIVALLDASGDVISGTETNVTNKITTAGGDDYTISIPVTNNVFGVKLSHNKQTGFNVRYYSFSLSYVAGGGDTPTPTTYTVTFDAGDGTFVGNNDFPNTSNTKAAGTYTLPSAERTGYTFDGWVTGNNEPITGSYEVSDDVDFTAAYTQSGGGTTTEHQYNFTGANNFYTDVNLTTHPGSGNGNNVGTIYYGDGGVFVASGTNRYFSSANSGYFMLGKTNAEISLPTFEGYKITQVKVHTSSGVSANVQVSIVSGNNTASAAQQWATNSDFTYNIAEDYQTSTLSLKVTNNYNSQFTSITLVCEQDIPSSDPSISAENVNIAYDAEEGTINYIINNPVEGGSIVASCDAEWIEVDDTPQTDAEGSIDFICAPNSNFYAHSATVTLTYTYGDSKATVTKDVTVTQALNPDANGSTIDYPIMVSEAIDAIDEVGTVSNIYVGGIVSEITASTSSYITFKMYDEDGDDYYLQAYHCTGNNFNEVEVGDQVVVYGTLEKYGTSVYQFASGCQLVSLIHPAVPSIAVNPDEVNVDATPAAGEDFIEGTLDLTWENLEITDFFEDFAIKYYDAEGEELADDPNWIMVDLATQDPNIGEGYLVSYMIEENEGTEARTAYFKVFALGDEDYVYSNLVTITQAAPVAPATGNEYALYTGELVEGDYLIVYDGDAMNTTVTNDRLQYEDVTVNNDVIVTDNAAIVWHIAPSGQYWTIYNADANAYAASTGAKSKAQMLANGTDDKALWTVSGTETYEFVNKKNTANNVNANLRKNGTYGFACYATATGGALSLYKKVAPTESYTLTIDGYTDVTEGTNNRGYYLIASPVTVDPSTVAGMTEGDFDLYRFNQAAALEWENWKNEGSDNYHFNLVPGTGYLYAKEATTENPAYSFELTGIPYAGNGTIPLDYTEGARFAGWNLIGNPFGTTAELDRDFYRLTENGFSALVSENRTVNAMEGVFVVATEEGENATFTVIDEPAQEGKYLALNIVRDRASIIDRAIVRIGEGRMLPKFQLNANDTKIYITEGNQDYAIVYSNDDAEIPVNFKTAERGTYTINVNVKNVEMSYLHLIDNLTGADVDLLQTPNYTFEANSSDYTNRFKLVFKANTGVEENTATETFAYFNGSEWVINNNGNATLQVVDMMGRVVSSETISGNANVTLNQAAGVYVLRLVNGENVKVQKVVVR